MAEIHDVSLSIAREIILRVAPEDAEHFEAIAEYQFSGINDNDAQGIGFSAEIGVAGGTLIGMLLPTVEDALKDLVKRLSGVLVDYSEKKLRNILLTSSSKATESNLTPATVRSVARAIRNKVLGEGLSDSAASALEEIIVQRLLGQGH